MRAGRFSGRLAAWSAVGLLAGTSLMACGGDEGNESTSSNTDATGATSISMRAGVNDPKDVNIAVLQYLPQSVSISAGSTVEWQLAGPEPHSVTFLAPGQTLPPPGSDEALFAPKPAANGVYDGKSLVNSGLVPLGPGSAQPFRLTFPSAGTFTYSCVIHPQMTGTVNVVDDGAKVDTQADIDSRAETELDQGLAEGRAAKQKLMQTPPVSTKNADGTTTWKFEMGATTRNTDVLAFAPPSGDVKAGDTVTFVNNSGAPHTASFAGKGSLPQNPTDPAVAMAAPGPSPQELNATEVFNTGLLPPNAPPGGGPPEAVRSFSFVARTAGVYNYVCILHVGSGMGGVLKVA